MSSVFTFEQDGLAYTVTVFEAEDGTIQATITMDEGSMDVNAVYWGDDDFSGGSVNLGGPLNMNGDGSQFEGESIQWDDALELSRPGLGTDGQDKETFLQEGESLTITLDVDSLDDVDFFGIRATSVNGDDSIKGVSGNPEIIEDPEEPEDPEDPEKDTYEKVVFSVLKQDGSGDLVNFNSTIDGANSLPEGSEGTFEEHLDNFLQIAGSPEGDDLSSLEEITFFTLNEEGQLEEAFKITAPEGGFTDTESVVAAYEAEVSAMDEDATADGLFVMFDSGDTEVPDDGEDESVDDAA